MLKWLFFLIMNCAFCYSQGPDFAFENGYDFKNIENDSNLNRKSIYLLGEFHHRAYNPNIEYTVLKSLNKRNVFPDFILQENGYSYSYIVNRYLLTGDEKYVDFLALFPKDVYYYKEIFKYNSQLKEKQKFLFFGIDYEKYPAQTLYAIKDLLSNVIINYENSSSDKMDSVYEVISDIQKTDMAKIGNHKINTQLNYFQKIYSSDSLIFKNLLKQNYKHLESIMSGYEKRNTYKKINYDKANAEQMMDRELYMADNIYKLIKEDSTFILFGRFGLTHVSLTFQEQGWTRKNYNSFSSYLNTGNNYFKTNKKVWTSIIYYDKVKSKFYKFLDLSESDLTQLKRETDRLYLKSFGYKNPLKFNYLIYFNKTFLDYVLSH